MGKRPDHVKPPAHLSESPPLPEPDAQHERRGSEHPDRLDPTRYGDWEKKGVAVDF
ncbi:MAG: DUF1674 domain-containing protein [Sphingomonas sp.]|nr:DUF1674 domain-containing protein [Sphingomonas sp.]|tara:strand:- start:281 stop:448 length:168 start_codon:yes stop_codon:yes gene_type:complete